jgi:hypothetical protein
MSVIVGEVVQSGEWKSTQDVSTTSLRNQQTASSLVATIVTAGDTESTMMVT